MATRGMSLGLAGVILIAASAVAGALLPRPDLSTAAGRGEAIGHGVTRLAGVVAGLAMVTIYLLRSRRK